MANTKKNINKLPTKHQSNDTTDFDSFKIVLFYCLLIIFFPIITFFATKVFLFDGYMKLETIPSNIYSAISAIIALHIALAIYISKAYFEDKTDKKQD